MLIHACTCTLQAAFGSDTADLYPQHESPAGYTSKQLYFFVGDSLKGFSKCLTEPSLTLYKVRNFSFFFSFRCIEAIIFHFSCCIKLKFVDTESQ